MPARSSASTPGLARLVEKQMRRWEVGRQQRHNLPAPDRPEVQPFVTISRPAGSGAEAIAADLADRLGWPCFDRELLAAMAGDDQMRSRLYESMDERDLGWLEQLVRALAVGRYERTDYFPRLTETILSLARQSPGVFVGRGADLILPGDRGLRVRLAASPEYCVRQYAEASGVDAEHAAQALREIERERAEFLRRHFNRTDDDLTRFDVVINIERWTREQAVALILAAMRTRGLPVPPTAPG